VSRQSIINSGFKKLPAEALTVDMDLFAGMISATSIFKLTESKSAHFECEERYQQLPVVRTRSRKNSTLPKNQAPSQVETVSPASCRLVQSLIEESMIFQSVIGFSLA
jgi:hypothetical protein